MRLPIIKIEKYKGDTRPDLVGRWLLTVIIPHVRMFNGMYRYFIGIWTLPDFGRAS